MGKKFLNQFSTICFHSAIFGAPISINCEFSGADAAKDKIRNRRNNVCLIILNLRLSAYVKHHNETFFCSFSKTLARFIA